MIKSKSILDQAEQSDGRRILVSRMKPLGISLKKLKITKWIKQLAPSRELGRDWKKSEISWGEFCSRYKTEMSEHEKKLVELAEVAMSENITLICHEPEHHPHCHRHILKRLIAEKGAE